LFLPLTLLTGNNISDYLNEVELVWLSIESSIDNIGIFILGDFVSRLYG